MLVWIKTLLSLMASVAEYYSRKQLIDAGKVEAENDVLKAGNQAREKARKVKSDNAALSDADIVAGLQDDFRD